MRSSRAASAAPSSRSTSSRSAWPRKGSSRPSASARCRRGPARVGVVTALTGAAVHDIVTTLRGRLPARAHSCSARCACRATAPVATSSRRSADLAAQPDVDVVIVGRGGGSIEDLWAFNDERVARAIAACPVPVVSAVGHEIDVTLADLAADCRAATPTAAAALVVPDARQLAQQLARARRCSGVGAEALSAPAPRAGGSAGPVGARPAADPAATAAAHRRAGGARRPSADGRGARRACARGRRRRAPPRAQPPGRAGARLRNRAPRGGRAGGARRDRDRARGISSI